MRGGELCSKDRGRDMNIIIGWQPISTVNT
jgi:hypothetical protein